MLFRFDQQLFKQLLSKHLTPSQIAYIQKQGLKNPSDFLLLSPKRYDIRRYDIRCNQLEKDKSYAIIGKLRHVTHRLIRRNLTVFNAMLATNCDTIPLVWFNQYYVKELLKKDPYVVVYGKLETTNFSTAFQVASFDVYYNFTDAKVGKIMPFYQEFKGVSNKKLISIISDMIQNYGPQLMDMMPDNMLKKEQLLTIHKAVSLFHFPSNQQDVDCAKKRFVFDELFSYLFPRRYRHFLTKKVTFPLPMPCSNPLIKQYLNELPYKLTGAQQRVWRNIQDDIQEQKTVFRLIQGDVGSGKTDIAILSLLVSVGSGYKAAMIVPTEILAEQHYIKCTHRLKHLGVTVVLLKGKQKKKARETVLAMLASDEALIVIGTHALIQDSVEISNLGFLIVDEQHRFGVFQRQALLDKSTHGQPHCIFMTATPIPRTLMLTHYGDLDHDTIDEMPPGRQPSKTYYGKLNRLNQIHEFIRLELKKGHQAYVVYPLIEESKHLDLQSAIDGYNQLSEVFSEFNVGLIHGRLSADEKDRIMSEFKANNSQVLVSTTVIEVGIDVPNASVMVIMNAERFGLSQLHQLRGRVGRGDMQSHCFLVADAKSIEGRQRVKAMLATSNGFKLAEEDLKIRGPGNLLGSQQSGEIIFSFANLMQESLIKHITSICDDIIQNKSLYHDLFTFFETDVELVSSQLN